MPFSVRIILSVDLSDAIFQDYDAVKWLNLVVTLKSFEVVLRRFLLVLYHIRQCNVYLRKRQNLKRLKY